MKSPQFLIEKGMLIKTQNETLRKSAKASLVALSVLALHRLSTQFLIPLFEDVVNDPVGIPEYAALPARLTFDFVVVGGGTAGCAVAAREPSINYVTHQRGSLLT